MSRSDTDFRPLENGLELGSVADRTSVIYETGENARPVRRCSPLCPSQTIPDVGLFEARWPRIRVVAGVNWGH